MSEDVPINRKPARWAMWLPLVLFAGFVALVLNGLLRPAANEIESAMVGKPLPAFALEPAVASHPGLSNRDFASGEPQLLNIFASWCVPCAIEAPQLETLAAAGHSVQGVAIRDRPADVEAFLAKHGNPFERIGSDEISAVQLAIGSSGVPETFIVDGDGVIRYQHIGVIRADDLPLIYEEIEKAR